MIAAIAAVQARDIEMGGDSNYPYSIMAAQQQGLYGVPATATGIYMHTCAM